jgi:outer membrane usher protein
MCLAMMLMVLAVVITSMPLAMAQEPEPAAVQLFLKVDVNGTQDGPVVYVEQRGSQFAIKRSDLRAVGLRLVGPAEDMVGVTELPGVQVAYDAALQRLSLAVPPSLLPTQRLTGSAPSHGRAISESGALISYDLFAQKAGGRTTASLWSEQRAFSSLGVASNSGTFQAAGGGVRYVRYDTRVRFQDERRALTATMGDIITGALNWGSAVRMGGVQIARSFRLRPDLIVTPLPQFAGQASVPSSVDLFINGQRARSETVRPGPFLLDTPPVINGAGEAVVVTTDAVGRRVAANIPFYVATDLLRPGLVDFSVEAGALRRGYGWRSLSYGMAG